MHHFKIKNIRVLFETYDCTARLFKRMYLLFELSQDVYIHNEFAFY